MNRWARLGALCVAACAALVLASYALLSIGRVPLLRAARWHVFDQHFADSPIAFDAERWRSNRATPFVSTEPRYRMAQTLDRERVLLGRARDDVVAQLGAPDATRELGREFVWLLRREPAYRAQLLVVRFDAQDHVDAAVCVHGEWYASGV